MNDSPPGQDSNVGINDPSVSTLTTQNLNNAPKYSALIRRYYLGNEQGSQVQTTYQYRAQQIDLGETGNPFESDDLVNQGISFYQAQYPNLSRGIQLDQQPQQMDIQIDPSQIPIQFAPQMNTEFAELMWTPSITTSPQNENDTRSSSIDPLFRRSTLELNIKQGWYKCFLVWIYFVAVSAMMVGLAVILIVIPYVKTLDYVFYLIPVGWSVVQFGFEISAILRQNLLRATIGLGLMIVLVLYLLTMVIYSIATGLGNFHERKVFYILNICGFGLAFVLQLSCIYGAIRVRKLLMKIKNTDREIQKLGETV